MSPEDFRRLGYLQELNRQFLHPLGLALSVTVDEETGEWLGPILDMRDDPEGIIFGEDIQLGVKAGMIQRETKKRWEARQKALGYVIQPVIE